MKSGVDSNYKTYDHVANFSRVNGILAQPQSDYEDVSELPDRDRATKRSCQAPQ